MDITGWEKLDGRATQLADSWLNGNASFVMDEIDKMEPAAAAFTALRIDHLLGGQLSAFSDALAQRIRAKRQPSLERALVGIGVNEEAVLVQFSGKTIRADIDQMGTARLEGGGLGLLLKGPGRHPAEDGLKDFRGLLMWEGLPEPRQLSDDPADIGISYRAGKWRKLTPQEAVYLAERGRFPWPEDGLVPPEEIIR